MDKFEQLGRAAKVVQKFALYDGAGTLADAIKAAAGNLPFKGSTVSQIQSSLGITTMRDNSDGVETTVGFDGYFEHSGFPIAFFVAENEIGTSRIPARPFIKPAVRSAKPAVLAAMDAAGNAKLAEIEEKAGAAE